MNSDFIRFAIVKSADRFRSKVMDAEELIGRYAGGEILEVLISEMLN
jgi:hypothetical protein